jgi:Glycoside Hydrolase Family 113
VAGAALFASAAVLATGGCGDPSGTSPTPSPSVMPAGRFDYNGITHVSWWHDEYLYADAADARRALADTGSNWGGVLVTWYMDERDSSDMAEDPLKTPTDEAVSAAIRELRGLGLRVMLKPHVDVKDGTWRGTVQPADPARWFAAYRLFLTRYAALAEASGAEMLCVGTELATLSDARYAAEWRATIAAVRAVYRGLLTYAANANTPGDEYTSVSFWPLLDLPGLDVYTPLTAKTNPSRAELVRGWTSNRYGHDMVAAFRNWQASHGKPVIFTEIGYRSADGTNLAPWDYQVVAPYDPGEQADCYAAAFEVFARETPWMKGAFWWDWSVPLPRFDDTDFTPRGKPAEQVLRTWTRP